MTEYKRTWEFVSEVLVFGPGPPGTSNGKAGGHNISQ